MKTTLTICLICLSVCNCAFGQVDANKLPDPKLPTNPNNVFSSDTTTSAIPGKVIEKTQSVESTDSENPSKKLFLKPKKSSVLFGNKSKSGKTIPGSPESMAITFGVLAAMIIGILLVSKLIKRKHPAIGKTIPDEAFEILGRKSLNPQQTIHFFRCGSKILIVGSTDGGLNTLSEIEDPVEVDFISGLCRSNENSPGSSMVFQNLFSKKVAEDRSRSVQSHQRPKPERKSQPNHLDLVTEQLDRAVLQQQLNQQRVDRARTSQNREERRA